MELLDIIEQLSDKYKDPFITYENFFNVKSKKLYKYDSIYAQAEGWTCIEREKRRGYILKEGQNPRAWINEGEKIIYIYHKSQFIKYEKYKMETLEQITERLLNNTINYQEDHRFFIIKVITTKGVKYDNSSQVVETHYEVLEDVDLKQVNTDYKFQIFQIELKLKRYFKFEDNVRVNYEVIRSFKTRRECWIHLDNLIVNRN